MTDYLSLHAKSERLALRKLILSSAEAEVSERGYKQMTIESVGQRAGVAESFVWVLCGNKASLVLACIDRMTARVISRLRSIAHAPQPVPYRLRQILLTRVIARFDAIQPFQAEMDEIVRELEPALSARRKRDIELESHYVESVFKSGVGHGIAPVDDPRAAAMMLILATNELLPPRLTIDSLGDRHDLQRRAISLVDSLLGRFGSDTSPDNWRESPRIDAAAL